MKISGARNRPRMMISGARNLQSHNEVFWAQKSSFLDDFWGQKSSHIEDFWAQNVCRVIRTISALCDDTLGVVLIIYLLYAGSIEKGPHWLPKATIALDSKNIAMMISGPRNYDSADILGPEIFIMR